MRRICSVAAVLLVLLSSCTSFASDSYYDSYSGSSGGYDYSYTPSPYYSSRTYSTLYDPDGISNWPVLVICPMENFMLQRETEIAIVDVLKENGIQAQAASDYPTLDDAMSKVDLTMPNALYVVYSDMYTYEIGGGIAELYFDCNVYSLFNVYENTSDVARISGSASSSHNGYLSFGESVGLACKEAGEAVAREYLSLVR